MSFFQWSQKTSECDESLSHLRSITEQMNGKMESIYNRVTESSATYQALNHLNRPFWIKHSKKTPLSRRRSG